MPNALAACLLAAQVLLIAAGSTPSAASESSLALGPALILLRDVPVGRPLDLTRQGVVHWQLENHGDQEALVDLRCTIPESYAFAAFEKGYEAPPDASWFHIDRDRVTVPAHGSVDIALTIDLPDRAELRNRHWIVYIDAQRAQTVVLGAALRLRARIMLETEPAADIGEAEGRAGEILAVPSVANLRLDGARWQGAIAVRSNLTESATFDLLHPSRVYPDITKAHRHFANLREAVLAPWARPDPASFTLGPGERRTVSFSAPVQPGQQGRREEVLFLARRARPGADPKRCITVDGQSYERMELIRLRCDQPTVTPAESTPPAP